MNKLIIFVFAVVLLIGCSNKADIKSAKTVPTPRKTAYEEVKDRYASHEDSECRRLMTEWINAGKVRIVLDSQIPEDTIGTMMTVDGVPALILSDDYFQTSYLPPVYYDDEKNSSLYHEFIHVQDHFSGKYPLRRLSSEKDSKKDAENAWGAELHATEMEWEFLKKIDAELKFFRYPEENVGKSERQALLDMLLDSLQHTYQPDRVQKFLPTWQKLYLAELKKN